MNIIIFTRPPEAYEQATDAVTAALIVSKQPAPIKAKVHHISITEDGFEVIALYAEVCSSKHYQALVRELYKNHFAMLEVIRENSEELSERGVAKLDNKLLTKTAEALGMNEVDLYNEIRSRNIIH